MRAVLPLHLPDIDELEIGLVDERSGLQGMPDPLVAHLAPGDAAKLRVDQRNELLETRLRPPCPIRGADWSPERLKK
jgi:hypothetical protein